VILDAANPAGVRRNPFTMILAYRRPLWRTTLSEVRQRYAGSTMGLFWVLLAPGLLLALYACVFIYIYKTVPEGMDNTTYLVQLPYRENLLPYSPHLGCSYQFVHLRTYDRPLLRQALREAGFAVERLWHDGYVPELARGLWRRNWVGQELHRRFQQRLRSRGRDTADVTRLPHGLRQILLQPTVVIAAGRKISKLAPMGGGGFAPD
jgi:hypothetical protein